MLGLSAGAIAAIVAAAFWGVLVIFLALVLWNLLRLLRSTQRLLEGIAGETLPMLSDARVTVSLVNRELDKADVIVESAGGITRRVERLTAVVEQALATPLIKTIAVSAGISRALRRIRKEV